MHIESPSSGAPWFLDDWALRLGVDLSDAYVDYLSVLEALEWGLLPLL